MNHYTKTQLHSLIKRFEAKKLPKAEWTHEAHLAIAIWYTSQYPFREALDIVRLNTTNHNKSVGTPNTDNEGYHETITQFWLMVANRFLSDKNILDIALNCNLFIASDVGRSSYPLHYYSKETLFSIKARHHWLAPDLRKMA